MPKASAAILLSLLTLSVFVPAQADAREYGHGGVVLGLGLGLGCCGYYPGYYGGYYPNTYYAPPPVVYAVPEAPPPVIYVSPPPQVVYAAPPQPAGIAIDASSPAYTDSLGRTCRQFQSGASKGMACLQSDGTWRVVP